MAGGQRQPWVPIDMDVADKTARIRVLEVQQDHHTKALNNVREQVDALGDKVDRYTVGVNDKLDQVSVSLRDFQNEQLNKQLSDQEKKFNKALIDEKEKSELSAKVKFIWTAAGAIIAGVIALLIAIFKTRFGG